MVENPLAQWAFTISFALLAVHSLLQLIHARGHLPRTVGHGLHVLMAADMTAMPWAWWSALPGMPQVLLFAGASAWYLAFAVQQIRGSKPASELVDRIPWQPFWHALMMLAMVWMVAAMRPEEGAGTTSARASGGHAHATLSAGSAALGSALTAALTVAGVIVLIDLLDCLRDRGAGWWAGSISLASGVVMSLGMAAMCWLMLAT